jgi:hypothetical protein
MLKDSKFLIYCGAPLACAAVALPTLPSDAVFCVDNRVMCAPLMQPMDDDRRQGDGDDGPGQKP